MTDKGLPFRGALCFNRQNGVREVITEFEECSRNLMFQQNLRALRRRFKNLGEMVEQLRQSRTSSVLLSPSRNGPLTAAVRCGERDIHVHSAYDPTIEARRWVDSALQESREFAVVLGVGLGYHLEQLLEREPRLKIVAIEPSPELFLAALTARDLRALLTHPRLQLIVSDDPEIAAERLLASHGILLLHEPNFLRWPAVERYSPGFAARFWERALALFRSSRSNLRTQQVFFQAWAENPILNLEVAYNDPGIATLLNAFRGRPGIIVAAGPSLERNVSLLNEVKGKAVVIAAGSAIKPLIHRGIQPDLIVSFDAGVGNYRHFQDLRLPDVPLVYIPIIYPRIVSEYAGPRFVASCAGLPFVNWLLQHAVPPKGSLEIGPSVANVSWDLASQMGLSPVILMGQDLAYTGMKSHAEGAAHARNIAPDEVNSDRYFKVTSVDGGQVLTDRAMFNMKLWFETRLKAPSAPTTIDATEGGALIDGTIVMSFREAINQYCWDRFDPLPTILKIHDTHKIKHNANSWSNLRESLIELSESLRAAEQIAVSALRAGAELRRESQTRRLSLQRHEEATVRLQRLLRELSNNRAYSVVLASVTAHVLESLTLFVQERWKREQLLYRKGMELAQQYTLYFSSIRDAARRINGLVRDWLELPPTSQEL